MPLYEVRVTATKTVLVKADNENDAEDIAHDKAFGMEEVTETEVLDEAPKDQEAEYIKEYKDKGEYYK